MEPLNNYEMRGDGRKHVPARLPFDMSQLQPSQFEERPYVEESLRITINDPVAAAAKARLLGLPPPPNSQ